MAGAMEVVDLRSDHFATPVAQLLREGVRESGLARRGAAVDANPDGVVEPQRFDRVRDLVEPVQSSKQRSSPTVILRRLAILAYSGRCVMCAAPVRSTVTWYIAPPWVTKIL